MQDAAESDREPMQATPDSDEGLVFGQTEVMTPAPTKEPRPAHDSDSSPDVSKSPLLLLEPQHMPYGVTSTVHTALFSVRPATVCMLGISLPRSMSSSSLCSYPCTAFSALSEAAHSFLAVSASLGSA